MGENFTPVQELSVDPLNRQSVDITGGHLRQLRQRIFGAGNILGVAVDAGRIAEEQPAPIRRRLHTSGVSTRRTALETLQTQASARRPGRNPLLYRVPYVDSGRGA